MTDLEKEGSTVSGRGLHGIGRAASPTAGHRDRSFVFSGRSQNKRVLNLFFPCVDALRDLENEP